MANLKVKDRRLTEEREELEETVSLLKHEVFTLKEELLRHADCDCAMIRQYLALEANKIVEAARQAAHLSLSVGYENTALPGQGWD